MGAHINKSIFGKVLLGIEKVDKTFLISDKLFSRIGLLLCALRGHISKIYIVFVWRVW